MTVIKWDWSVKDEAFLGVGRKLWFRTIYSRKFVFLNPDCALLKVVYSSDLNRSFFRVLDGLIYF